jgi:hypothetical protein
MAVFEFASDDKKQKVECLAIYAASNSSKGRGEPMYALSIRPISKDYAVKPESSMTVVAERYVVSLVPIPAPAESRYYKISKAFLMRIANTRSVEFVIDEYRATLSEEAKEFFRQLLSATE